MFYPKTAQLNSKKSPGINSAKNFSKSTIWRRGEPR